MPVTLYPWRQHSKVMFIYLHTHTAKEWDLGIAHKEIYYKLLKLCGDQTYTKSTSEI